MAVGAWQLYPNMLGNILSGVRQWAGVPYSIRLTNDVYDSTKIGINNISQISSGGYFVDENIECFIEPQPNGAIYHIEQAKWLANTDPMSANGAVLYEEPGYLIAYADLGGHTVPAGEYFVVDSTTIFNGVFKIQE